MIDSIESLFELDCRCDGPDAELWRCLAIGAAADLGLAAASHLDALTALRWRSWNNWRGENPDRAVSGEVNQYLQRILCGEDDMATATKRKKPEAVGNELTIPVDSELSQIQLDHGLNLLCCPTPSDGIRWSEFRKSNPTNEDLNYHLSHLWEKRVVRETPPCCASSGTGTPLVWFGQTNTAGTPDLSGDKLLDEVRRVMRLPAADEMNPTVPETKPAVSGTLSKAVKSKAKAAAAKPEKVSAAELFAGVEVIEERDVPWDEIKRSKQNPRQKFDEQLIADMEPNIEQICRVTPLTLREDLELIDGETRHRSAAKRKPALRCKIIRCTDAQAAAMRLLSAVQRRDLNPIEKAASIKSLQENHGLSQRQLEDLVKLKQGTISNMTRLLELPDEWQQLVISGEITPADARELVPWKDEPTIMKLMAKELKDRDEWFHFSEELKSAIHQNSKPMTDKYYWTGTKQISIELKPTPEVREKLRIHTVKLHGKTEERAFNVDLWKQLVDEIVKRKSAKSADKRESAAKADPEADKAKAKENAKKQAEQLAKRLYRFRVGWYQAMCRSAVAMDDGATEDELIAILLFLCTTGDGSSRRREALQVTTKTRGNGGYRDEYSKMMSAVMVAAKAGQVRGFVADMVYEELNADFCGYQSVLHPQEIEALAESLEVNIATDWSTSFDDGAPCADLWDEFCGLWSKDQILKLLDEWKIKRPDKADSMKRADLAKLLTAAKGCPKAISNAKPVRLS